MTSSTFQDILADCPRFRILTSGKSGVGKTTLIKETFKIGTLKGSDKEPGRCNIEDELVSPENELFVLHDSQGFEAGEIDNFNRVKDFIVRRSQEPLVKNRLHAVWLCVQIPSNSGRLLEAGDEEFLKLPFGDVPVIIVYTQYDRLCDRFSYDLALESPLMDRDERNKRGEAKAEEYFQKYCIEPIRKIVNRPKNLKSVRVSAEKGYRQTLESLVEVTLELVRNHVQESVWIVSAAAQRVNADTNVAACINVGITKYWRGMAAGTYFANQRLRACIGVIHGDIVSVWNFRDEDKILRGEAFMNAVCILVQDLADYAGGSPGSATINNLKNIKAALDVATPMAGPLGPVVASVGLSVMFVKWLSEMYTSTPGVLRCLMGYIVDVTIVLEILFWFKVAQPSLPLLCQEDIDAALGMYQGSDQHLEVHRQIRSYADNMLLLDHMKPDDKTHLEVERLINDNRRIFVETILSETTKQDAPAVVETIPPVKFPEPQISEPQLSEPQISEPGPSESTANASASRSQPAQPTKQSKNPKPPPEKNTKRGIFGFLRKK